MQVFGLPGHVTRNGGRALHLLGAKPPNIEETRRREAVTRWRRAMRDGLDAGQAARAVGVPRSTLYRWEEQPAPKSRRPHRVRQKNWSRELRAEVERLRCDFPFWGKDKLGPLLRKAGMVVSNATVGRILKTLVERGRVTPVPQLIRKIGRKCAPKARPHAIRKPRDVAFEKPGDVIQIDGGSEFMAEFETACRDKNLPLYVLPPRSPKLNGAVERCNGAWRYEFYATVDLPTNIDKIAEHVDAFQYLYNHHRPHGALDGLTPNEYLKICRDRITQPSHMS